MARTSERGATAIIVAIVLAMLCGFVALSLDVGHLFSVRGELQNGADAAALAGAKLLNGTNLHSELPTARSEAENYARNHPTDIYDVEPTLVELGAWVPLAESCGERGGLRTTSSDTHQFCAISGVTEQDAANINAVRVVTQRTGSPGGTGGGAVPLAFGPFVGKSGPQEVRAEAIALTGGPCGQGCPELPIAIRAQCLYGAGKLKCDPQTDAGKIWWIGLSSAPEDTAAITSLSSTVEANPPAACDVLRREPCKQIDESLPINLQNGNSWTGACDPGCPYQSYQQTSDGSLRGLAAAGKNDKICEVIRRRADRNCDGRVDDADGDGAPDFRTQVPVIEGACDDTNYNHPAKIVGWATVAIVSARCETEDKLPFDTMPITQLCDDYARAHGDFSASTCVAIQLYCNQKDDETSRTGCGWWGTSSQEPALVR